MEFRREFKFHLDVIVIIIIIISLCSHAFQGKDLIA